MLSRLMPNIGLRSISRHAVCEITQICGIDEAGRGAVIGPLVVCSFAAADTLQEELTLKGFFLCMGYSL